MMEKSNKFLKQILIFSFMLLCFIIPQKTFAKTSLIDNPRAVVWQNVQKENKALMATELDKYKRPVMSHIVVRDKDEEGKRVGVPSAPINMSHWLRNQRVKDVEKGYTYLWNKGHGIGNQFGGAASNDASNIVAETVYLNQVLMLSYEGSTYKEGTLDNWLHQNPDKYLDYYVFFNYAGSDDNIPVQVVIAYRGINSKGVPVGINLPEKSYKGMSKQKRYRTGFTAVTMENIEPGFNINYKNGQLSRGKDVHSGWKSDLFDIDGMLNGTNAKSTVNSKLWLSVGANGQFNGEYTNDAGVAVQKNPDGTLGEVVRKDGHGGKAPLSAPDDYDDMQADIQNDEKEQFKEKDNYNKPQGKEYNGGHHMGFVYGGGILILILIILLVINFAN